MPPPPPIRLWYTLAPWKYPRPWARVVGTFCLVFTVNMILAMTYGGIFAVLAGPMVIALCVIVPIDTITMFRDHRKSKKTMTVLKTWNRVIQGAVEMHDLSPEMQEEIAVERTRAWRDRLR